MLLFGKKSKNENSACCCAGKCSTEVMAAEGSEIKSIKVLGAGCKSCHTQYENVKNAVAELGILVEVEYITDLEKVMEYGVMSMPAIVVNDRVAAFGKVLNTNDVINF